jgi:hypothetical protein
MMKAEFEEEIYVFLSITGKFFDFYLKQIVNYMYWYTLKINDYCFKIWYNFGNIFEIHFSVAAVYYFLCSVIVHKYNSSLLTSK